MSIRVIRGLLSTSPRIRTEMNRVLSAARLPIAPGWQIYRVRESNPSHRLMRPASSPDEPPAVISPPLKCALPLRVGSGVGKLIRRDSNPHHVSINSRVPCHLGDGSRQHPRPDSNRLSPRSKRGMRPVAPRGHFLSLHSSGRSRTCLSRFRAWRPAE